MKKNRKDFKNVTIIPAEGVSIDVTVVGKHGQSYLTNFFVIDKDDFQRTKDNAYVLNLTEDLKIKYEESF